MLVLQAARTLCPRSRAVLVGARCSGYVPEEGHIQANDRGGTSRLEAKRWGLLETGPEILAGWRSVFKERKSASNSRTRSQYCCYFKGNCLLIWVQQLRTAWTWHYRRAMAASSNQVSFGGAENPFRRGENSMKQDLTQKLDKALITSNRV